MNATPSANPADLEPSPDVIVEPQGSIVILRIRTDAAREWVDEYVEIPDHMRLGEDSFAADVRPANDLLAGMADAGLTLA